MRRDRSPQHRRRIRQRLALVIPLLVTSCTYPSSHDQMIEDCPDSPLRDALRREARIGVIVTLETAYRPEAELTGEQAADQRRRIATLQDQLISDLVPTSAKLVRRYERFPMLALQVDEPALCQVLGSSLVRRTERDTEVPPTTGA